MAWARRQLSPLLVHPRRGGGKRRTGTGPDNSTTLLLSLPSR